MLRGKRLQSAEGGGSIWGNDKNVSRDFPGGPVVKNPVASAGEPRLHSCARKIPRAAGQLNPCATSTEAYMSKSLRSATREATAMSGLHATTREQPPRNDKDRVHPRMWKSLSCVRLCDPNGLYSPWNSPGANTAVGSRSLLQGKFPTQGSNPGVPYCGWILSQLSHKGSQSINPGVGSLSLLQWIFPTWE